MIRAAAYALDQAGQLTKLADVGGKLAVSRERVFVYNPTGLYRLNEATRAADLVLPLDDARFPESNLVLADDGTLIIAHRGYSDRRLIAVNPDGTLRWDRSVMSFGRAVPHLIAIGRNVYAVTANGQVLLIDTTTGAARSIFDGGAPTFLPGQRMGAAAAERLRGL